MRECPYCRASNAPERRYCTRCGRQIAFFCVQCGFANETEARYCGGCGQSRNAEIPTKAKAEQTVNELEVPEAAGPFAGAEAAHLVEINRLRRQTLALSGSRKNVTQQELDKLFDKETG